MTIRILYIVAALIAAVWISYKIELSRGWTVFFTLLVLPTVAVVILLVGVTGGICRVLWRHRRQKRTQEILNTPLEELADTVLKKYGEEGDE